MKINTALIMRQAASLLDSSGAQECEDFLNRHLGDAEANHDNYAMVVFLVGLAELFQAQGRAKEAQSLARRVLTVVPPDSDLLKQEREQAASILSINI